MTLAQRLPVKGKMISLSVPTFRGNELEYVKQCIKTEWVSTAGQFVSKFEDSISEYTKSKHAVAVVNGTSALHIALKVAGVKEKDEVIAPTLTFIAPINAILYNHATPVFMDCDDYYNIDAEKTIDFIKQKTVYKEGFSYNKTTKNRISAIVPVHVWGNAANLKDLFELCKKRNIATVEDASESLGTFYNDGAHSGTNGLIGCISFNGNKIITSGGGGMVITDDAKLANTLRYLTTQAKDDSFNYVHNEVGFNYRLTNIQAGLGLGQLEQLPLFLKRKKKFSIFINPWLIKLKDFKLQMFLIMLKIIIG